ncbi:uncharacterized protein LOC119317469 isoform X2 [Triticum dicoccoides]|uniref:uncharacterized protein LOC119317469 isoform X2 n=1 Tax=Triticum dicoccoides TaxID=85692 RepID=UPI00189169DE|nr:uncharacterized protein LOC119317469 isoform X2 [Triticum dicoccoides]
MRTLEGEGSAAAFHGRRLLVAAGGTSRRAATSSFSHVPGHERHKGLRSRGRCQGRGAGDSQADAYHQQPLRPRATSRCWCPASICSPRSLPHVRYMARTQIWVSSSLPACAKNSEPAVQQMKPTRTMINFSDLMSAPIRRRRRREEMKWRQLEGLLGGLVQFSPAASFARFGVQKSEIRKENEVAPQDGKNGAAAGWARR